MLHVPAMIASSVCFLSLVPLMGDAISDTREMVQELADDIRGNYVFPEKGEQAAAYLLERADEGAFDGLDDERLAQRLTEELRNVTEDLHFAVRPLPTNWRPQEFNDEGDLAQINQDPGHHGFMRIERMDGNIGYLKLDGFDQVDRARESAHAAMQLLSGSSALIVDLRNNGGGDPETVQLLTSYLFDPDEPVHLNSLYFRPTDETTEYWTHSDINAANAMPDVPVFVLTSGYTFSAAEEFSYNLRSLDRATIIGERTGGGAHPVDGFVIDSRLMVNIPVGRAINPITKTNWEGTGVEPHISVPAPEALDAAIGKALEGLAEQGDENAQWGLIMHRAINTPIELSESQLEQYAGQYTDRELMVEDGLLMYRRKGSPSWNRMIAVDEDRFIIDGIGGFVMNFDRDPSGNITKIVGEYQQRHSDESARE